MAYLLNPWEQIVQAFWGFWQQIGKTASALWSQFIEVMSRFEFLNLLDILLVSFIIYSAIKLVRETRAEQLVKGIIVLLVVWAVSSIFNLYMMSTLLTYFFSFAFLALLIVFQPEIRHALEQIGRTGITKGWSFQLSRKEVEEYDKRMRDCIKAVVESAAVFQRSKTGALMVFERKTKLGEIINTGTLVEATPSVPLIGNIFFNKAPLHDGAMVLRDGMIYAAGCILPLTRSANVSIELGTRHRAGLGMSENSDAVVVIVSEETGQISIAMNGVLTRNYTRETLQSALDSALLPSPADKAEKRSGLIPSRRRKNHEKE